MNEQHQNEQKFDPSNALPAYIFDIISDLLDGDITPNNKPLKIASTYQRLGKLGTSLKKWDHTDKLKAFGQNPKELIQAWRSTQRISGHQTEEDKIKEVENAYEWHSKRIQAISPLVPPASMDELIGHLTHYPNYHIHILISVDLFTPGNLFDWLQQLGERETFPSATEDRDATSMAKSVADIRQRLLHSALISWSGDSLAQLGKKFPRHESVQTAMKFLSDTEVVHLINNMPDPYSLLGQFEIQEATKIKAKAEANKDEIVKANEVLDRAIAGRTIILERILNFGDLHFIDLVSNEAFFELYSDMTPDEQQCFDERIQQLDTSTSTVLFFTMIGIEAAEYSYRHTWVKSKLDMLETGLPPELKPSDLVNAFKHYRKDIQLKIGMSYAIRRYGNDTHSIKYIVSCLLTQAPCVKSHNNLCNLIKMIPHYHRKEVLEDHFSSFVMDARSLDNFCDLAAFFNINEQRSLIKHLLICDDKHFGQLFSNKWRLHRLKRYIQEQNLFESEPNLAELATQRFKALKRRQFIKDIFIATDPVMSFITRICIGFILSLTLLLLIPLSFFINPLREWVKDTALPFIDTLFYGDIFNIIFPSPTSKPISAAFSAADSVACSNHTQTKSTTIAAPPSRDSSIISVVETDQVIEMSLFRNNSGQTSSSSGITFFTPDTKSIPPITYPKESILSCRSNNNRGVTVCY